MPSVNVLYDTTTGRILAASLGAISPVPAGHAIETKTLDGVSLLFEKRIDPTTLNVIDKDYLEMTPAGTIKIATVPTVVLQKKNGETDAAEDDVDDDEAFSVSTRDADQGFTAPGQLAFFNVLSGALSLGVASLKLAAPPGPAKEVLVFRNDTLRPLFKAVEYVI